MANPIESEPVFGTDRLLHSLAGILTTHRAVGGDFPASREAMVTNLRALQSALPAAIAEVEGAMKEGDEGA